MKSIIINTLDYWNKKGIRGLSIDDFVSDNIEKLTDSLRELERNNIIYSIVDNQGKDRYYIKNDKTIYS